MTHGGRDVQVKLLQEDNSVAVFVETLLHNIARLPDYTVFGRVASVQGLLVEVGGIHTAVSVGDRVTLVGRATHTRPERQVLAEVVGFRQGHALLMPFGTLDGIGLGARASWAPPNPPCIRIRHGWDGWSMPWARPSTTRSPGQRFHRLPYPPHTARRPHPATGGGN